MAKRNKFDDRTKFPDVLTLSGASEPLELTAAAEGETPVTPAFRMVAYNGGAMDVGFGVPVVVDLAGAEFPRQDNPVLREHDPARIVGHTAVVASDGGKITIAGAISGVGADAAEVIGLAKNKYPLQASIGGKMPKREYIEAGQKISVNGRTFTGPVLVARQFVFREVSIVSMGADYATTATVAASHKSTSELIMADELNDGQKQDLAAAAVADIRAKSTGELTRIAKIREVCGDNAALAAESIAAGWTPEQTEAKALKAQLETLRASRPDVSGVAINTGGWQPSKNDPEVIQAALASHGKLPGLEKHFKSETLEAAHKAYKGRIGLQEVLLEAAYAGGYRGRPFISDANLKDVLRAGFSTNDIDGILSNTANKFLMNGFTHVENVWAPIASKRSVKDFKTVTSYRMTGAHQFTQVGPTGELKHSKLGEQSFTNSAKTYGVMHALPRTDIINDDLGALSSVPRMIGRGAALKLNDVFWTEFMDNSSFFASGNSNYISGSTTNLSSSSLQSVLQKFRDQTDPDSKPLAIQPKYLLVPTALEVTAMELMQSTTVNTGGSSSSDKVPNKNVWAGKYEVIVSTYLSNSSYTGYSSTAFYLLADPMDESCVEVAFLNGQEQPTIESSEADFNTLGIQMRGYFDFGVAKQSYRGGVKSKGAA